MKGLVRVHVLCKGTKQYDLPKSDYTKSDYNNNVLVANRLSQQRNSSDHLWRMKGS